MPGPDYNLKIGQLPPGTAGLVARDTRGTGFGHGGATGETYGGSATQSESESLVPIHEDLTEVSSVTFQSFDEWRTIRAGEIRKLTTGQALVKLVNDPNVYRVAVDQPTIPNSSRTDDAVAALTERNRQSGLFVSASEIDREAEELRLRLLMPPKISAGACGDSKPVVIENEHRDDQASAARTQSPFEDD